MSSETNICERDRARHLRTAFLRFGQNVDSSRPKIDAVTAIELGDLDRGYKPYLLPPPGTTDAASVDHGSGKDAGREIKEWQAIMDHLRNLPITGKGELPVIPVDARAAEVRAVKQS